MDNIFRLGFKEEVVEGLDYKVKDYGIKNSGQCYCSNCKTHFESKEVLALYVLKCGYKLDHFRIEINSGKEINEDTEVCCPNCGNTKAIKELREIQKRYQLCNEFFVNGDKINVNSRSILFNYFRGRIVTTTVHDMVVINMKTGFSYELARFINGKKSKNSTPITNCTYSHQTSITNYEPYSDKCKKFEDVIKGIYNAIRDYKINNKIVEGYVPTFEQNEKYYNAKLENDELFYYSPAGINTFFNMQSIFLFNRFPCINVFDSKTLFAPQSYYASNDIYKQFVKIRRAVKQDDPQAINSILEKHNIPKTKKNKALLLTLGLNYVHIYKALNNNVAIDNIYKLVDSLKEEIIDNPKMCKFFEVYALTKQQENNLCNKIANLKTNNEIYTVKDFLNMAVELKESKPEYEINLNASIKELHDLVLSDYRKIQYENIEIDYSHIKNKALFEYSDNGLTFRLAKDTHELIDVGAKMHICVGSYRHSALKHYCHIVIVRDTNENPVVCIELDNELTYINQAKLKYNNLPTKEIGLIIEKWAQMNNLDYRKDRYLTEDAEMDIF